MNRKVRVIYWSRSWPVVKPLTPILISFYSFLCQGLSPINTHKQPLNLPEFVVCTLDSFIFLSSLSSRLVTSKSPPKSLSFSFVLSVLLSSSVGWSLLSSQVFFFCGKWEGSFWGLFLLLFCFFFSSFFFLFFSSSFLLPFFFLPFFLSFFLLPSFFSIFFSSSFLLFFLLPFFFLFLLFFTFLIPILSFFPFSFSFFLSLSFFFLS